MDKSTPLTVAVHAGGGHSHQGGHGHLELTADGKRVVDFARSLPDDQNAAVIKAFGLDWTWTGMDAERYGRTSQAATPSRYDAHTGKFYQYGEADNSDPSAVQLTTDPTLLLDQGHAPAGSRHGGQTRPGK